MSRLIHILNAIKEAKSSLELTPSQQTAHRAISDALQRYGQCNLHGASICGKTFLCWRIAQELGIVYLTSPSLVDAVSTHANGVIIDNASQRRSDYRRLLATVQIRQHLPLLYVSRLPVEEDMPQVKLQQTLEDQAIVNRNLVTMKFDIAVDTYTDFWDVIVMAAGGSQ